MKSRVKLVIKGKEIVLTIDEVAELKCKVLDILPDGKTLGFDLKGFGRPFMCGKSIVTIPEVSPWNLEKWKNVANSISFEVIEYISPNQLEFDFELDK